MQPERQCAAPCLGFDATPYLTHVARLLDDACARDGFSNVQLAKFLKVGRDSVSKQRKGVKWLEVPPLLALAQLLDVRYFLANNR